jgi:hypothetical protein
MRKLSITTRRYNAKQISEYSAKRPDAEKAPTYIIVTGGLGEEFLARVSHQEQEATSQGPLVQCTDPMLFFTV